MVPKAFEFMTSHKVWHLFLMNKRKGNISVKFSLYVYEFMVAVGKSGQGRVTLLYCGISGCSSGITLAVSQGCKQPEPYCVCLSHPLSLSPLSPVKSTSLVPSYWCLTDSVRQRHRRGPLSFSLVYSSTGKHDYRPSRQPKDREEEWQTHKGSERNTSADVCGEATPAHWSDTLPIMRHCLSTNVESVGVNQPFICR